VFLTMIIIIVYGNRFITRTKTIQRKNNAHYRSFEGQVLTTNHVSARQNQNANLMRSEHIATCDFNTLILSLNRFTSLRDVRILQPAFFHAD
jgi:hypothetical protein